MIYLKLIKLKKKQFPNIYFKIGNKKFLFNAFSAVHDNIFYLTNKDNMFYFGQEFLKLFDLREFNIESGDINLYLNKIKPLIYMRNITKEKNNKKNLELSFISNNIILLISIIILFTIYCLRKYNKNIKIEYYNYYYKI